MSRIKDITGSRHKMLVVESNSGKFFQDGSVLWNCRCDCGNFVSVTGKYGKAIRLHNFVFGNIPDGFEVDHKNRKKYDNRRCNLRQATRAENNINHGLNKANTSGYVGVSYVKQRNKYRAYITVDNKQISLGLHNTLDEAYQARLEAERKYFGEFSSQL